MKALKVKAAGDTIYISTNYSCFYHYQPCFATVEGWQHIINMKYEIK
jgi:hypothetical protein